MNSDFKPGFRLSVVDLFVLLIGIILACYMMAIEPSLSYIILFVVGHFFLFCNVVRMARLPELIWSVVFTVLCIASLRWQLLGLTAVFLLGLTLTLILVLLELRKCSYHGILWRQFNPNLASWFFSKK